MNNTRIGTFYQGQKITISIQVDSKDESVKTLLSDNEVYFGVFRIGYNERVLSTEDGTLTRKTLDDGTVVVSGSLTPLQTKTMKGAYTAEIMVKSKDNSSAFPTKNVLSFDVEERNISKVIL